MTKVINKLVSYSFFENLGIEEISAGCYDENIGSKKGLIKNVGLRLKEEE